jgi:hypothetical protein
MLRQTALLRVIIGFGARIDNTRRSPRVQNAAFCLLLKVTYQVERTLKNSGKER